ncbi:retrotransposon protein, putative, ty1-copia subclass [Tanacetum coccineum]
MADEPVVKEKQRSLVDTSIPNFENTDLRSYPPLPTQGSTPTGNTPGMSSYANVTGVPNRKALNFCTLYTPGGNGIDVVVPVESIRAIRTLRGKYGLVKSILNSSTELFSFQFSSMDGLNAMLENGRWFIRNHPLIIKKWNPDVNLLKEDVGNVSVWVKLHGVPVTAFSEDGLSVIATKLGTSLMLDFYTSDMCLQSWGRSSYAKAMIELRADMELKDSGGYEECLKNPGLGVAKNFKKPSQAPRGVSVGPRVGFKPTKEYRPVSKKPTANTIGTKKKGVEPTKELEKLIIEWKVTLVDDDGKPLKKVDYPGDHDSEDESSDFDEEPYDDNMYEGHDLPDKIQDIRDNLDIRVRGRRKK